MSVLLLGSGGRDEIVYKKAYYYVIDNTTKQPMWKELDMMGGGKPYGGDLKSGWQHSHGVAYIGFHPGDVGKVKYVVGYVCKNIGGQWKCGCSDTTCAEGKWQLQIIGDSDAEMVADTGPGTYCHIASERQPGEVVEYTTRKFAQICAGLPGNYHTGPTAGTCEEPKLHVVAGDVPLQHTLSAFQPVLQNFLLAKWRDLQGVTYASPGVYSFTLARQNYRLDDDTDSCEFQNESWRQDYKVTVLPPADYERLAPMALPKARLSILPYRATTQLPDGYQNWDAVSYIQELKELPCCKDVSDNFPAGYFVEGALELHEKAILNWHNQEVWRTGTFVLYFTAVRKSDFKRVALPITLTIEP